MAERARERDRERETNSQQQLVAREEAAADTFRLKSALRDRDSEVSTLKASLEELRVQAAAAQERTAQVEKRRHEEVKEASAQAQALQHELDEERRKARADMQQMRGDFAAQLSERDERAKTQRLDIAELSASFEELSRQLKSDAAAREDVLRAQVREAQSQVERQFQDRSKVQLELEQEKQATEALKAELERKEADLAQIGGDAEGPVALNVDKAAVGQDTSDLLGAAQDRVMTLEQELREAARKEGECRRQMQEMRRSMEEQHLLAMQDQEKFHAQSSMLLNAETRCKALSSELSESLDERGRVCKRLKELEDSASQMSADMEALERERRLAVQVSATAGASQPACEAARVCAGLCVVACLRASFALELNAS